MRRAALASACVLAALGASADPAAVVPVALPATTVRYALIDPRDAAHSLGESRPPGVDADSPAERELLAFCSRGEPQRVAAEKGLVSAILGTGFTILLDKAAEKVRTELAKYSALSEASTRVDYYRGGVGRLDSRYACLRFTRIEAAPGKDGEVALDFVAGIGLDATGDALLLRPLRLWVSRSVARSANGHYGVVMRLRAEATWREGSVGREGTVFDRTLVAEAMDLSQRPFLSYYPLDSLNGQRAPIVPLSSDVDRSRDYGRVDLTLSAAEIGTQPAALLLLQQLLPSVPDRRTHLLLEAIQALEQAFP